MLSKYTQEITQKVDTRLNIRIDNVIGTWRRVGPVVWTNIDSLRVTSEQCAKEVFTPM